ncbi:hypothetical protein HMF8227_01219 [Saliniradius amylolyticus]|uniref:Type IV secretion system putative lipoprotein virB7 n=1 Tax=Saliniradius amylolyticus TaxID=2183582 RepID=A0A2S2E371_9ALTE|nr:membrane lipoprotein lipid attachment site-containing protein [Saliniradius amylolyticus]AWL11700.1 hypothetical protein HMF8227_01219 [Saliniradius amylolyticus]
MKKILTLLVAVIVLSGCKSTMMQSAQSQKLDNAESGSAQVVFVRSAFVAQAIQASVFDVTNGEPEFIGIVSDETQVKYDTEGGERMFMVVGESADFLKAELKEGKTYYSIVTPRMGFWKARFSLHPVRNDDSAKFSYDNERVQKMMKNAEFVEVTPEAEKWATNNMPDIKQKYAEYLPAWKSKDVSQRQEATLRAEDHL